MKILIIDDDVEIVWVIQKLLEIEDYQATTAVNGDQKEKQQQPSRAREVVVFVLYLSKDLSI